MVSIRALRFLDGYLPKILVISLISHVFFEIAPIIGNLWEGIESICSLKISININI